MLFRSLAYSLPWYHVLILVVPNRAQSRLPFRSVSLSKYMSKEYKLCIHTYNVLVAIFVQVDQAGLDQKHTNHKSSGVLPLSNHPCRDRRHWIFLKAQSPDKIVGTRPSRGCRLFLICHFLTKGLQVVPGFALQCQQVP